MRIRIEDLVPDREAEIAKLLDLESDLPDGERALRIRDLLTSVLLPVLERASSVRGIKELRTEGLLMGAAIRGAALPVLEAA